MIEKATFSADAAGLAEKMLRNIPGVRLVERGVATSLPAGDGGPESGLPPVRAFALDVEHDRDVASFTDLLRALWAAHADEANRRAARQGAEPAPCIVFHRTVNQRAAALASRALAAEDDNLAGALINARVVPFRRFQPEQPSVPAWKLERRVPRMPNLTAPLQVL
jgi:hypothetical protein